MKTIYLSLGSNVGSRDQNIARAIGAMSARGLRIVRQSSLFVTEPVDIPTQSWFLNCAVEAETDLMPRQLLHVLQEIEHALGRRRLVRRGPRVIDIDILLYGSNIIRSPDLEVPHPRMTERRFVLVPLREIAPSLRHPSLKMTIAELLASTPDLSHVHPWHPEHS
jgi:2-amino-4-hydroxy-6-hydroxymethyldihydropteridine diphosphokinase